MRTVVDELLDITSPDQKIKNFLQLSALGSDERERLQEYRKS